MLVIPSPGHRADEQAWLDYPAVEDAVDLGDGVFIERLRADDLAERRLLHGDTLHGSGVFRWRVEPLPQHGLNRVGPRGHVEHELKVRLAGRRHAHNPARLAAVDDGARGSTPRSVVEPTPPTAFRSQNGKMCSLVVGVLPQKMQTRFVPLAFLLEALRVRYLGKAPSTSRALS